MAIGDARLISLIRHSAPHVHSWRAGAQAIARDPAGASSLFFQAPHYSPSIRKILAMRCPLSH